MKKIQILKEVEITGSSSARVSKLCTSLFKHFAKGHKVKKAKTQSPGQADLVVIFLSPKKMKTLNSKFRRKNYPTDILSFAFDGKGLGLGELVICPAVLRKQASLIGHSFKKELDYMIIHGFLHLLGYDHEKSRREELKMFKLQDKLFAMFSK